MPRPEFHHRAGEFVPGCSPNQYLVLRREDAWFIKFQGEEFGPYQSEREVMLFAIDAAHKLGSQGKDTEVLQVGETGETRLMWTYRLDPYPPRP